MGIILSLLLGCLAGFCAGKLMKGGGFGLIVNCVLGLFGGVLGGWLFDLLGISWGGILGQLGTAIIGAALILWIASFIKKKKKSTKNSVVIIAQTSVRKCAIRGYFS